MLLGCSQLLTSKNSCEKQPSDISQNWACIFTSNCLQKTNKTQCHFYSITFCLLVVRRKEGDLVALMYLLQLAAHRLKENLIPLTFNQYLCLNPIYMFYTVHWHTGVSVKNWKIVEENTKARLWYCSQMHGGCCDEILF